MTVQLTGPEVAARIRERFPDAVLAETPGWAQIAPESIVEVCAFLRDDPTVRMDQVTNLTSVDWIEYFEVVYHLQSIRTNQMLELKCRPVDRAEPEIPSVSSVWYGAWLQEMEVYDLMGIRFSNHPDLRRLFLWEGFSGWPLRKEFLQVDRGAFSPGLPHFPKEGGERGLLTGPNWAGNQGAFSR